jgi:lipopolysaccharide biosynthesis glycosyltransferase
VSALHVCCAIEGDYVPHSAAMLHSVVEQSGGREVHVHYLHGRELSPGRLAPLRDMLEELGAEISFVELADDLCAGLPIDGFTRKATWYRILLPDLLPDLERILFLDADLLALDSLAPLWETDLTDCYLAAVTNVFMAEHLFRPTQLGIDWPQEYFNAGVMVMNLELMRREGCTAALRKYGVEHAHDLIFRDQDVLNVVLRDRRRALHPRWNCMNALFLYPWSAYVFGAEEVEEARRNPAIRHFEGPSIMKPWVRGCQVPYRECYFEHRRATPWPDVPIEGVPKPSRHIVRRIRRRLSA